MSGGSFSYLFCAVDCDGLDHRRNDVEDMAAALREYPGGEQAAADSLRVIEMVEQARRMAERLSEVWRAVEWDHSGDSGPEHVARALEEYGRTP